MNFLENLSKRHRCRETGIPTTPALPREQTFPLGDFWWSPRPQQFMTFPLEDTMSPAPSCGYRWALRLLAAFWRFCDAHMLVVKPVRNRVYRRLGKAASEFSPNRVVLPWQMLSLGTMPYSASSGPWHQGSFPSLPVQAASFFSTSRITLFEGCGGGLLAKCGHVI